MAGPTLTGVPPTWRARLANALLGSGLSAGATGYAGAATWRDTMRGWIIPQGSPDEIQARDRVQLQKRAADLRRNEPFALGIEHTKNQGVVGTGLTAHASIDRDFLRLSDEQADACEDAIDRYFGAWADSADSDARRTLTFYEQQEVAFRGTLRGGDHFVQLTQVRRSELPFQLALQHITAARVCNPNWAADNETLVGGIARDDIGAPLGIHVANRYPQSVRPGAALTWSYLPLYNPATQRRQVLHMARVLDADETRPVPDLSPIIHDLKQVSRYKGAELDAAVNNAAVAMLIRTATSTGLAGLGFDTWRNARGEYYRESPIKMKEGQSNILALFPDDDVTSYNPNRPNPAFEAFVEGYAKQMGMALELPHEVVMKTFASSYSAARAALLIAWGFYVGRRYWLTSRFCQPVRTAFVDELVAYGFINAPGYFADPFIRAAYNQCDWVGDSQGQIDETKSIGAAMDRINGNLSTHAAECGALTGKDWRQIIKQKAKEQRLMERLNIADTTAAKGQPQPQPSAEELDQADQAGMVAHG